MAKPKMPSAVTDDEVRALLERHGCPVPFHEVRTRFLGTMASPELGVSPMKEVERLWGGKLPEFDSLGDADEVLNGLVMGMWNRLSKHQDRGSPFRLTRVNVAPDMEGLARLASIRRQELDGFVEGLFGNHEAIDLPERAHRAVRVLHEMRAMIAGVVALAGNEQQKPPDVDEIRGLQRQMRDLTRIAEHEMHEVILSCKRARKQLLESSPAQKPTIH